MTFYTLKRLAVFLIPVAGAVACAQRPAPPPAPSITVAFADPATEARIGQPAIEVATVNRLPLATAELVGPDGAILATAEAQPEPQYSGGYPYYGGPDVGVGVYGGSGGHVGTGVYFGFPLGGYGGYGRPPDAIRSRAHLPVPDMATYRQRWEQSLVRLKFGTAPGETLVTEIPAPAPGGR